MRKDYHIPPQVILAPEALERFDIYKDVAYNDTFGSAAITGQGNLPRGRSEVYLSDYKLADYGYIEFESTKEIYLSNIVCYDFTLILGQEKSTKVVSGITKYYNKLKIKLSDLDDLPGRTIYVNFFIDIFKGSNATKKIKTQFLNATLYYSSEEPEGD